MTKSSKCQTGSDSKSCWFSELLSFINFYKKFGMDLYGSLMTKNNFLSFQCVRKKVISDSAGFFIDKARKGAGF
ncbi:hypothetical protein DWB84_09870 [Saccharophagus sp. K07]|nr:hypothetical protein [Saccharophagus sp. K07]